MVCMLWRLVASRDFNCPQLSEIRGFCWICLSYSMLVLTRYCARLHCCISWLICLYFFQMPIDSLSIVAAIGQWTRLSCCEVVQAQHQGQLDRAASQVGGQPLHATGHRLCSASLHPQPALQVPPFHLCCFCLIFTFLFSTVFWHFFACFHYVCCHFFCFSAAVQDQAFDSLSQTYELFINCHNVYSINIEYLKLQLVRVVLLLLHWMLIEKLRRMFQCYRIKYPI